MHTARTDLFAWLERKLDKSYPILYIDATYWNTRREESVSNEAYYTVLAVKSDRTREVISVMNHPTEGATNWENVFRSLNDRGLEQIQLVVCDGLIINNLLPDPPLATAVKVPFDSPLHLIGIL